MTATTLDRNTLKRGPCTTFPIPLAASTDIPFGVMIAVATPAAGAVNASQTATLVVMGISGQAVSYAAGDRKLLCEKWAAVCMGNNGNITAAHIGQPAYVVDNQTVGLAADTNPDIIAGTIIDVTGDGVWIKQDAAVIAAT